MQLLKNGFIKGVGFALGIGATAIFAVTVSGTMNTFSSREVVSASQINTNFATLKAAIETAAHPDQTPPVGTIMAWHKNLTPGAPALPAGWMECNGQMVTDTASVFSGTNLPDLNGQRRFLRGNATSGPMENSQFSQHTHRNNIIMRYGHPTWIDLGAGFTDLGSPFGGTAALNNAAPGGNAHVGFAGTPGETRPINMSVVWIIRVR